MKVFVTAFHRPTMLATCLESLRSHGLTDITVIDNTENGNKFRHLAAWGLGLVPKDEPYIVTDGDCAISDDCPDDFMLKMLAVLHKWPVEKVGLGINIANFPDPLPVRYRHTMKTERAIAKYPLLEPGVRDAPIDTTFAMYRAGGEWPGVCGVRLEAPYLIEHLPWLNPEYSDEEHDYYRQPGMTAWARTHSAASEVPPKVIVPFTALRSETVVALGNSTIPYEMVARPIIDDEGFFWALDEAWTPTTTHEVEPFIVIEHDIAVNPNTLQELRDCPEDWCAAPYPYLDRPEQFGLGCVKFSDRLICRNPWLFSEIQHGSPGHPPRHWCTLDSHIYRHLINKGETRCENHQLVGHVGQPSTSSAHGCFRIE